MNRRGRLIKAHLTLMGITQCDIAREAKVTSQMVSAVIAGKKSSSNVNRALIKFGIRRSLVEGMEKAKIVSINDEGGETIRSAAVSGCGC